MATHMKRGSPRKISPAKAKPEKSADNPPKISPIGPYSVVLLMLIFSVNPRYLTDRNSIILGYKNHIVAIIRQGRNSHHVEIELSLLFFFGIAGLSP